MLQRRLFNCCEKYYLATNFTWDNTRYAVRDRKEHFAYPVVEIRPAGDLTVGIYDLRAGE